MENNEDPASFAAADWLKGILQEYEDEVKMEHRWPTLLLQPSGRQLLWSLCDKLGVASKGVPASACRLFERYLARRILAFLQEPRDNAEWERYKDFLASRFHLLIVSCILLTAKMTDQQTQLSASVTRTALMKEGMVFTKTEIVQMEHDVYSTLDYRLPLWTTMEMAEFLASQVGLMDPSILEAVGLVMNMAEFHRNQLELHMRCCVDTCITPSSSSSYNAKASLYNIQICAAVVSAAARYMRPWDSDPTDQLATLIRNNSSYIKAISDTILNHIIPEKTYIPILKKRRMR